MATSLGLQARTSVHQSRSTRSYDRRKLIENSATTRVSLQGDSLALRKRTVRQYRRGRTRTACFSQDISGVTPAECVSTRTRGYPAFTCSHSQDDALMNVRHVASTSRLITRQVVGDWQIPLPPLAEQRRIAEVLDRAEALRAKRRAALAQLDSLTQSLFLDLFGDPATNREGIGRSHVSATVTTSTGTPYIVRKTP